MRLGIVMPVYLQEQALFDLTYRSVASIAQGMLYVVCTRLHNVEPDDLLKVLREKNPRIEIAVIREPFVSKSVARAWNEGLNLALYNGADRLLLMANDVILEPDTLDELLAFDERNTLIWSGTGARNPDTKKDRLITEGCDFSCCMMRRDTIATCGWFDENYRPAYFEDNDFCARVWMAGGEAKVIHAAQYEHIGSATKNLDPEAAHHVNHWFGRNAERFREKWGHDPVNTRAEALRVYRASWRPH